MSIVYDIQNLAEYLSCPYKLTFKNPDKDKKMFETTLNIVTKELLYYYIGKRFLDKPIRKAGMHSKLNLIWKEIKEKEVDYIGKSKKREKAEELLDISNRIDLIMAIYEGYPEFLAFDYEISYRLDQYIIKGKIASVSKSEDNQFKALIIPEYPMLNDAYDNYYYKVLSDFYYLAIEEELKDIAQTTSVQLFNTYKGSVFEINRNNKKDIEQQLLSLIKGIENNIFPARPSYYTCELNCRFKTQCKWKIKH